MFVKVKISTNYPTGTVVSYDDTSDFWQLSSDSSRMFGVIEETPTQDSDNTWWSVVRFGGSTLALADRDIPSEGGYMQILNGKVYASSTDYSSGVIAPLPRNESPRVAGDLVLIYLR